MRDDENARERVRETFGAQFLVPRNSLSGTETLILSQKLVPKFLFRIFSGALKLKNRGGRSFASNLGGCKKTSTPESSVCWGAFACMCECVWVLM